MKCERAWAQIISSSNNPSRHPPPGGQAESAPSCWRRCGYPWFAARACSHFRKSPTLQQQQRPCPPLCDCACLQCYGNFLMADYEGKGVGGAYMRGDVGSKPVVNPVVNYNTLSNPSTHQQISFETLKTYYCEFTIPTWAVGLTLDLMMPCAPGSCSTCLVPCQFPFQKETFRTIICSLLCAMPQGHGCTAPQPAMSSSG